MQQNESQPDESITTCQKETTMGRITFGDMSLELPIDDRHKANRKVLGGLGREIKDGHPGKPVLPFQQLADQLGYGDRRDVQNFPRDLRQCDVDVQAFVTRKAAKHDRRFPLIETAVLETPLLSPHQQYVSFCEAHPTESLSKETFPKYAHEIDGVKIVKRVQHLVKPGTKMVDLSGYFTEVLASERLSGAKKRRLWRSFLRWPDHPHVSQEAGLRGCHGRRFRRNCWWCSCMPVRSPRISLRRCLEWGKRVFPIGFMTSVVKNWSGRFCARLCAGAEK